MSLQRRYHRENRERLALEANPLAQALYLSDEWATETAALLFHHRTELPRVWCDGEHFAIERNGERCAITKVEAVRLAAGDSLDDIFGLERKTPGRETRTQTQEIKTK